MTDLECLYESALKSHADFLEELHDELIGEDGISRNLSDANIKQIVSMLPKIQDNNSGWEFSQIDPFYQLKAFCGSSSIDFDELNMLELDEYCTSESRVLVIYTGGTIGMKLKDGSYEPESNYLCRALRKLPMFHDSQMKCDMFTKYSNVFVMPRSRQNRRVIYVVFEYDPLVDSCDITMDDYIHLALDINRHYDDYDGFVILHGTDTLAYTASALSFLLENLTKPVIITGSQIPVYELRSDGRENFLTSLMLAGHYQIPEVTVFFHEKLFRGNRVSKISSSHFEAFDSPNFSALATLGVDVRLHLELLLKDGDPDKPLTVSTSLCNNVSVLRIFPSITIETVAAFLSPPVEGVVIQTYGAGNVPLCRKDILQLFKKASDSGVIIVNISQCWKGGVKSIYKCGNILAEYGVIPGMDMTPEAALVKLSYVLGKSEWSLQKKREAMVENLRGELSIQENPTKLYKGRRSSIDKNSEKKSIITTAICIAAQVGDVHMLKKIGSKHLCWEVPDQDGRRPLQIAVSANRPEIVRALLPNCTLTKSINSVDSKGRSLLLNAILLKCDLEIIESLLEFGAILDPPGSLPFMEKFFDMVKLNEIEVLLRFHLAKFNFNVTDDKGNSVLHLAVEYNNEELVRFLIDVVHVDMNTKNHAGLMPKELAVGENVVAFFNNLDFLNSSNSNPSGTGSGDAPSISNQVNRDMNNENDNIRFNTSDSSLSTFSSSNSSEDMQINNISESDGYYNYLK